MYVCSEQHISFVIGTILSELINVAVLEENMLLFYGILLILPRVNLWVFF